MLKGQPVRENMHNDWKEVKLGTQIACACGDPHAWHYPDENEQKYPHPLIQRARSLCPLENVWVLNRSAHPPRMGVIQTHTHKLFEIEKLCFTRCSVTFHESINKDQLYKWLLLEAQNRLQLTVRLLLRDAAQVCVHVTVSLKLTCCLIGQRSSLIHLRTAVVFFLFLIFCPPLLCLSCSSSFSPSLSVGNIL